MMTITAYQPNIKLVLRKEDKKTVQQNIAVLANPSQYYPFVNLIRFVSMMGIVWAHVCLFTGYKDEWTFVNSMGLLEIYIPFMQMFKFGVICFFMISGFLLGDNIKSGNLTNYFKRRLKSTSKPFLITFSIFFTLTAYRLYFLHHQIPGTQDFKGIITYCLFDTPLWYLPNYLIALLVTICFSKFLDSKFLGIGLFSVTSLYALLTVYTIKYQAPHTTAIFGYIFYLWLGIYIRQNNILLEKIKKISLTTITVILLSIFIISCLESYILFRNHLGHFHILRIFNQLYSVTMFVFLIRVCNSKPDFGILNPRKETYGIYLYHGLFSAFLLPKMIKYFNQHKLLDLNNPNIYTFITYHLLLFFAIYLITTLLVKVLLRYNLGYLQSKS